MPLAFPFELFGLLLRHALRRQPRQTGCRYGLPVFVVRPRQYVQQFAVPAFSPAFALIEPRLPKPAFGQTLGDVDKQPTGQLLYRLKRMAARDQVCYDLAV